MRAETRDDERHREDAANCRQQILFEDDNKKSKGNDKKNKWNEKIANGTTEYSSVDLAMRRAGRAVCRTV